MAWDVLSRDVLSYIPLADIFPDSETGGLMTLNAYYSIICLKKS